MASKFSCIPFVVGLNERKIYHSLFLKKISESKKEKNTASEIKGGFDGDGALENDISL